MTAEQHNLHCDLSFLLRGKNVKCSENSLLPLWKVFQQRFLYRGNREFQNKKLSMFCVFILTFLWCSLWLAAMVYHVYWNFQKVLDIQILEMKSLLPIKNPLLLRVISASMSFRILNTTNILHVMCSFEERHFSVHTMPMHNILSHHPFYLVSLVSVQADRSHCT